MVKASLVAVGLLLALPAFSMGQASRPAEVSPGVAVTSVLPSATDKAIDLADEEHTIYVDPTAKQRGELLLFLPGTNGKTKNQKRLLSVAARVGYKVVSLMYPDEKAAALCWNDEDKEAFAKFRWESIEGGDKSPYLEINRANSIENRLVKLLQYLKGKDAAGGWDAFLAEGGDIKWEKIAVCGQSQGGGHAAIIATRHEVARVLMFSSPKDWSRKYDAPAGWYDAKGGKTPVGRYYGFVHEQDLQGCNFAQQLEIFRAMGMYTLGEPANVDKVAAPYGGSHILTTNYPGTKVTSKVAHTTEMGDLQTPRDEAGRPLFEPIWRYMLTAER